MVAGRESLAIGTEAKAAETEAAPGRLEGAWRHALGQVPDLHRPLPTHRHEPLPVRAEVPGGPVEWEEGLARAFLHVPDGHAAGGVRELCRQPPAVAEEGQPLDLAAERTLQGEVEGEGFLALAGVPD